VNLQVGLGILYTITLLERADLGSIDLVLTESGDNLVLVDARQNIYLNWDSNSVVNTIQEVKAQTATQQHHISSSKQYTKQTRNG
jgi:hypothetical protein